MAERKSRPFRRTFDDRAAFYGLDHAILADWLPRLRREDHARVVELRMAGATLKAAGEAIGVSGEKANQYENWVFRVLRAAVKGEVPTSHFKENV